MTSVTFADVSAAVGGTTVLRSVSFHIPAGEFVGVIGRSGSGKTSLIRTIAGFTDVVGGRVEFDGVDIARVAVERRDVGMVFQDPVVFPRRSIRRNVSFPLELRKHAAEEIRQRVDAEVRSMHLEHLLTRRPDTLSRGESQLVQIARTMVRAPRVLLLDEPLAGLDAALQASMRSELSLLQDGYGVTTVMATNDPLDALAMPDRLIVLDGGEVVQIGAPLDVRESPLTVDAALATGECSLVAGVVEADADGFWLVVGDPPGAPALRHRAWHRSLAEHVGRPVLLGIRPDDVRLDSTGNVTATVRRAGAGSVGLSVLDLGGNSLLARAGSGLRAGDSVLLHIDRLTVFDAATGRAVS